MSTQSHTANRPATSQYDASQYDASEYPASRYARPTGSRGSPLTSSLT